MFWIVREVGLCAVFTDSDVSYLLEAVFYISSAAVLLQELFLVLVAHSALSVFVFSFVFQFCITKRYSDFDALLRQKRYSKN